jgi:putative transposase
VVRELAGDGIPVATACRVLEVSTSGFYEWDHRPASTRSWDQAHLMQAIREAHAAS